jgi:hypothetical protein
MAIPHANPFLAKNSPKIELMLLRFHGLFACAGTVSLALNRPVKQHLNLRLQKSPVKSAAEVTR